MITNNSSTESELSPTSISVQLGYKPADRHTDVLLGRIAVLRT